MPLCHGETGCQGGVQCLTHSLWRDLSARISDFLDEITLGELVRQAEVKRVSEQQNKHQNSAQSQRKPMMSADSIIESLME
jgi:Rrf2 family iron-sulfur cluster assembly transcriptional regulator